MNLFRITIKNFRKYENATFPLSTSNLILGANGSGKTTITSALNLALSGDPVDKKDLITDKDLCEITITFVKEEELFTLIYKSNVKGAPKGTTTEVYASNKDNFEHPTHVYIPSNNIDFSKLIEDVVIEANPSIKTQQDSINSKIKELAEKILNNEDIKNWMVIDKDKESKFEVDVTNKYSLKNTLQGLELTQRGDGYTKNISLAVLKMLKEKSTIVLIDEIENHLSIPNVKEIIKLLVKEHLVVFSSHRLEADLDDIKNILFLGEKENDISGAIDSLKIEISKYEKVILVEGKNDYHYIRKYIDIKSKSDRNYNAVVVSVDGEGNMRKVFNGLKDRGIDSEKIYMIKDGDLKEKKEENVNYLKNTIEQYNPKWAEIQNSFNPKLVAAARLSFLNKDSELYKELDKILC